LKFKQIRKSNSTGFEIQIQTELNSKFKFKWRDLSSHEGRAGRAALGDDFGARHVRRQPHPALRQRLQQKKKWSKMNTAWSHFAV